MGDPPKDIRKKYFFYCLYPAQKKVLKTRHSCIAFQNLVFYCEQVHKQFCRQVAMTTTTVIVEKLKYMFSTTGGVESFRASGDQHVIRKTLVTFLIFFLMRTWKKMCLVFVFFGSWVSRVCRPTERKDIDPRVFLCM